jgi:thioredoxin 1
MVSPILDEISAEHGEKLTIVKVNVDEEPQLAQQYGITSIPALQVFQNGEVVKSIVGAKPKPQLLADLSDFIN